MTTDDVQRICTLLADPAAAREPAMINRGGEYDVAGLYSWWADDDARKIIGSVLGCEAPALVYVGQAGATKMPSGTRSSATLASRIAEQHAKGAIGASTFRKTIASIVIDELALEVENENRLVADSNRRLSSWIAEHLRVNPVPFDDRDRLGELEGRVVSALDPLLNLQHVAPTEPRQRLRRLRGALGADQQEPVGDSENGLAVVATGAAVDVVDKNFEGWLIRLEPASELDLERRTETVPPSVAVAVRSIADRFPEVARLLRANPGLRVVFSPQLRQLLATGEAHLMRSGSETLPVVVDATGKILGHGRVLPNSGLTMAGGGVVLGAAGVVAWPILLAAAAVGAAAAMSEQRWLERTFAGLESSMRRIEFRLRDDDAGLLEAADNTVELVRPSAGAGTVPPQLRMQLAVAQLDVDRVYASRRRFVERWKRALAEAQDDAQYKSGRPKTWAGDIADELADRRTGVMDEIVLFLQAMIVRARLTACTAAVVSADGDGRAALTMLDRLEPELRHDYHDLANRVKALAKFEPQAPKWKELLQSVPGAKIPLMRMKSDNEAHALMQELYGEMHRTIGAALPERDVAVDVFITRAALADEQ